MKRHHPNTNFIVLPVDYTTRNPVKMQEDLRQVLKKEIVDAVVFDTAKCDIDAVMGGATSPTTPILKENRGVPVMLLTGAVICKPSAGIVELPYDRSKGDTADKMKKGLAGALVKAGVRPIIFDPVMKSDGSTPTTVPALLSAVDHAQGPVYLLNSVGQREPVPESVNSLVEKPVALDQFCDKLAETIERGRGRGRT